MTLRSRVHRLERRAGLRGPPPPVTVIVLQEFRPGDPPRPFLAVGPASPDVPSPPPGDPPGPRVFWRGRDGALRPRLGPPPEAAP
jgi:hypothetical protein